VDLRHIAFTEGGATAPLVESPGTADLTLDPGLQRTADELLSRARPLSGAIILVDAVTGRVLVWSEHTHNGLGPGSVLLDTRAPAASLFKIVTSTALLERAGVSPDTEVCTRGGSHGIERRHLDPPSRRGDTQCTPFREALGHSRNAVFAQLVTARLARSDLSDFAHRFGFNGPAPFASDVTVGTLSLPYNDLEFARAATGFRGSSLSPLGALSLAFTVATGGEVAEIQIVERAGDYRAPRFRKTLGRVMKSWTARQLRKMMEITVSSGTSREAFTDEDGRSYLRDIRVAGKTGTLHPTERTSTTSWFVGFAPSRKPRVVVSVLLENGRVWHRKANEIGRDVLRAYFSSRRFRGITDPLRDVADAADGDR
jgi:cell division protein FtsI/penicillin-binding protein 2